MKSFPTTWKRPEFWVGVVALAVLFTIHAMHH